MQTEESSSSFFLFLGNLLFHTKQRIPNFKQGKKARFFAAEPLPTPTHSHLRILEDMSWRMEAGNC